MRKLTLLVIILLCSITTAQNEPSAQFKLAFVRYIGGLMSSNDTIISSDQIYTMNLDGSDLRPLTDIKMGHEEAPSWSNDAQQIVFVSTRSYFPENTLYNPKFDAYQLYIAQQDNFTLQQLTQALTFEKGGGSPLFPVWSPDGQWISFYYRDGIYLIKPDGTDFHFLIGVPGYSYWSPDNRLVAVLGYAEADEIETNPLEDGIGLIDIYTRMSLHPRPSPAREIMPTWSPDGQHIAFMSDRDGNANIYRVRIDNSELVQLTASEADEYYPAWSPNGKWIAYSTEDQNKLTFITPDGALVATLELPIVDCYLEWLPDSSALLFYRNFEFPEDRQKNYSAVYMLDTACLENSNGCSEDDVVIIPNTETSQVVSDFDISPIKLPSH